MLPFCQRRDSMSRYKALIQKYFPEYLKDLETLVSIESVSDETSSTAPFGKGVQDCFEAFSVIAKRMGFEVEEDEGYAISANLNVNEDPEYIGILGHLDIVEAGDIEKWSYPPFQVTEKEGIIYGRGVNDDKGPFLAQLYCIKILQDLGYSFKKNLKVIAGGAEETTWHCMEHYFKNHPQPVMAYSPDGNFPIVNGEKGILTLQVNKTLSKDGHISIDSISASPKGFAIADEIKLYCSCSTVEMLPEELKDYFDSEKGELLFTGKSALTRNPHKADNALFKMADFVMTYSEYFDSSFVAVCEEMLQYYLDPYGKDCGYYHEDKDMGESTLAVFDMQIIDGICSYKLDLRFDHHRTSDEICSFFENMLKRQALVLRKKRPLFVPQEDILIQKLSLAYENVCHEKAECFSKGGASYARVLDHGIAFGATFDGYDTRPHSYDENMRIEDLIKAMEIYCESIRLLACE